MIAVSVRLASDFVVTIAAVDSVAVAVVVAVADPAAVDFLVRIAVGSVGLFAADLVCPFCRFSAVCLVAEVVAAVASVR